MVLLGNGNEISWVRSCLGTNQFGYEPVWVRTSLGTKSPDFDVTLRRGSYRQVFTIAHMVIGISAPLHYFIHLRSRF